MKEIRVALQPKQKAFLRAIEETPITFYGGARGGGKSKAIQLIMLYRRFKYPGTSGAIFRRTYPELESNHIRPLFQAYPMLREYYNESKKLLSLPNGSTVQFCHCNNEADIALYQGREIEDLAIDEIGQWTEGMFRTLMASNRTSKLGIHPKAILAGNPGGIGHQWLKRLFIDRRFNSREKETDYAFIKALVYDNKALMDADAGYISRLEAEPNQALRKAWLEGDWDIMSGQYFSEIRREVHVVPAFAIPDHWTKFGSYDFGYNHPAAFGWFACDEDGNVFLYREFVRAQLRVDQFAQELNKYKDTKELIPIVAGWDCWAKKAVLSGGNPPTVAEEFFKHEIAIKRAVIDRVQGASQVRSYLAWQDMANGRNKPRFYIFDTCPISYEALARMIHDPDRAEDVLKVDATEGDPNSGDDAYDMIRYALMTRPILAAPAKVIHKYGSSEWAQAQHKRHEEQINDQAQKQIAQENMEDMESLSTMDNPTDALSYYIQKKRKA